MTQPDRRAILKLIAAGAAASVAGCSRPDETIHPMVNQPEGTAPGQVRRYATALPLAGYLRGVTGLVVDGRPIKLEGLEAHPASLGATDVFTEVSILDLYDPQRLKAVSGPEGPSSWQAAGQALFARVARRRGEGVVLLTGRVTSPTVLARIAAARAQWPGLRHVRWEPFSDDAALAGSELALGQRLTFRPALGEANALLCLGADPLGPGPEKVALARAWSDRRRHVGVPPRMTVLEPSPTLTGAMADRRVAATPAMVAQAALLAMGEAMPGADPYLAALLREASVGATLLAAGSPALHAAAAWANAGGTWIASVDPDPTPHAEGLTALIADMQAGRVDTLIVLDANPAYADAAFAEAMARVPFTVAATRYPDETSARCRWQVPLSHPLEAWHDGRAPDGTASIAQPLVRPLYDTRAPSDVVDLLLDANAQPASYARVRETWASLGEAGWKRALVTGVVPGTAATPVAAARAAGARERIVAALREEAASHTGLVADVRVSPTLYDGRFSANAWAQECPDPLTKEVWGASARLSPKDMAQLGLADGDLVEVARGPTRVKVAARGVAGQAAGVVTLLAGYGRTGVGAVADGVGGNVLPIGQGAVTLRKLEGRDPPPTTQHQFRLDGELAKLFPVLHPGEAIRRPDRLPTMLPNPPAKGNAPAQWAMAIDTDVCIGCNACVVACQAENNVPVIGPEEIEHGRDMHWLRVDRYETERGAGFQPVPCMQCEAAPCEPVCPVEASVHDTQGLNVQVYNRCVGTRTCQANCPYKVRRFNFLDYAERSVWGEAGDASISAQRNPDVTVRARGVMEKCTYCVQRIEAHNREADAGGNPARVVTACAAACPTRAITFGPLGSPEIDGARADPRHYALLEELGTRPRTTYLARRTDPGTA